MPIEQKLLTGNYSNSLELGLTDEGLRGRGGLIATQNVEDLLATLVQAAQFTSDFDDLPIPFRAVATDMLASEMVVLGEGELAIAMRASMGIPGVFAPVEIDGRILGDGAMMRNLPVDVARELCADVVIAVWLDSPQPVADDLQSSLGMFNRAFQVMVETNQREQIRSLTERDLGIAVPVADIGPTDFTRAAEAIDYGKRAAGELRDALARYSIGEDEYLAWSAGVRHTRDDRQELAQVEITGTERVNPAFVATRLRNSKPGASVAAEDIVTDLEVLYALGDFERVGYRLSGPADARTLEILVSEKSWGPDFIAFDYGITTSDNFDLDGILRVDHRRTWINDKGARWHNALQLGRKSLLETDFYQPLDTPQRYFVHPQLRYESSLEDLYLDDDRIGTYEVREFYAQLDFGLNVDNKVQLRAGARHGWQSAELETGLPVFFPELDREKDTSVQLRLIYDTRDYISLPTRGTYLSARYARSEDWFGSELDYSLVEAVAQRAFDFNGNSLSVMLGGANTLSGSTPVSQLIELGGIRTFPGMRPGELRGDEYWFAGTSYAWRLAELQPVFGQSLYGGFRLQAGEMRSADGVLNSGVLYGVSGSLSGRTPVGPFQLSLGYVLDRQARLQFTIGRPVPEGSLFDDLH
jgi:NTE family protein